MRNRNVSCIYKIIASKKYRIKEKCQHINDTKVLIHRNETQKQKIVVIIAASCSASKQTNKQTNNKLPK